MTEAAPLAGLRVVVTRARSQASTLVDGLAALGAETIELATIEIVDPADGGAALAAAAQSLSSFDQVVVASPNAARVLIAATTGHDMSRPPVACVGPGTASVFDDSPWRVNVVADRAIAEGLVDSLGRPGTDGNRLLLVQAEVARPTLETGLVDAAWDVHRIVGYRTVDAELNRSDIDRAAAADAIIFTSSSTVERYVRLAGAGAVPSTVVSIGPITSATASELGLTVAVEAGNHTIEGVVEALAHWGGSRLPRLAE